MRKLIIRSYEEEKANPGKYVGSASKRLPKSSMLGRDPFGDLPLGEEVSTARTDPEDWTLSADGEVTRKLLPEGDLLKSIQDTCHKL